MINSLDEAIKGFESAAEDYERGLKVYENMGEERLLFKEEENECKEYAKEHRQLAEWLKELQRYRFEISECKAILDNPTPDVTENDKKRAMYVLQTFPDVKADERGIRNDQNNL